MKKFLSLTLAVLLTLGLCACGDDGGENVDGEVEQKPVFRVGYGRESITPATSVPLAGYGSSLDRMSQGFLDTLYATCIAITDETDTTVLLLTADVIEVSADVVASVRKAVTEATGVPGDKLMLSATHTHSGPDFSSAYHDNMADYKEFFCTAAAKAAQAAMEDRAAAKLKLGTADTEGLNFVRHYYQEDGSVFGENYGSSEAGAITGHTTEADPELQLIRFTRGKKKDILLVNWQAHPKLASAAETAQATRSLMSADFIGTTRSYVEAQADVRFAYFQGAAGNLDTCSSIPGETVTTDVEEFGRRLGNTIIDGLKDMKKAQTGTVKTSQAAYTGTVDHTDDDYLEAAGRIVDLWERENDQSACVEMGAPYGIHSSYHAAAIADRAALGETLELELNAVSVGSVSFVTAPYEMFDTNGRYIKENTPYAMTFILGYTNGCSGYIPSAEAFGYGCYEVDIRRLEQGAAEDIAARLVDMLTELKEASKGADS